MPSFVSNPGGVSRSLRYDLDDKHALNTYTVIVLVLFFVLVVVFLRTTLLNKQFQVLKENRHSIQYLLFASDQMMFYRCGDV